MLAVAAVSFALLQSLVIPVLSTIRTCLGASSSAVAWLVTGSVSRSVAAACRPSCTRTCRTPARSSRRTSRRSRTSVDRAPVGLGEDDVVVLPVRAGEHPLAQLRGLVRVQCGDEWRWRPMPGEMCILTIDS